MRILAFVLVAALAGCKKPHAPVRPTPAAPTPAATLAAPAGPGRFSLHEWGLIGVSLDAPRGTRAAIGSGPLADIHRSQLAGHRERPTIAPPEAETPIGRGGGGGAAEGGKPVIYVHLLDGAPAQFEVRLRAPGGRFLEHWPSAVYERSATDESLLWNVQARTAACPPDPFADLDIDARCAVVRDHYCELPELPAYAASDAACLAVGDQTSPLLFYRSEVPTDALPLVVSRRPGGAVHVVAAAGTPAVGTLIRVSRDTTSGALLFAALDAPAAGASIDVPALGSLAEAPADAGPHWIATRMRALGLTDPEIGAFERAWTDDLFGANPASGEADAGVANGLPPAGLRRANDYIAYFLPTELADRLAPLSVTPAPTELKRALLIRVSLDPYVASENRGTPVAGRPARP